MWTFEVDVHVDGLVTRLLLSVSIVATIFATTYHYR